jgi:hypothetical protein
MFTMNIVFYKSSGEVVVIEVDGKLYGEYDLNTVEIPKTIEIETNYGYNNIKILNEGIIMYESNCPDQICVNSGIINKANEMIVCLPNRVVVRIESSSNHEIDGSTY